MTAFEIIYGTAPYCLWLCVFGLGAALAAVSGSSLPMWPAAAALAVAAVSAATDGLGLGIESGLFALLALALTAPAVRRARRAARVLAAERTKAHHPARLIGRIARSTGDFANGVGRVWIDDAEWAAELVGEEALPGGQAVRVTRVIGGVKLQVHPLAA